MKREVEVFDGQTGQVLARHDSEHQTAVSSRVCAHPFVRQAAWDFVVIDECLAVQNQLAKRVPLSLGIAPFCAKRNTPLDGAPFALELLRFLPDVLLPRRVELLRAAHHLAAPRRQPVGAAHRAQRRERRQRGGELGRRLLHAVPGRVDRSGRRLYDGASFGGVIDGFSIDFYSA